MDIVSKLKHWQVFICIIIGTVFCGFTIEGSLLLTSILRLIGILICLSWPLAVGYALYQRVPEKINLPYNLFVINCFITIAAYAVALILLDGKEYTLEGLWALPGFYVLFAVAHSFAFPVKALRSIELGEEAKLNQYIGDVFLAALLPLGIWFLQPRINRVVSQDNEAQDVTTADEDPIETGGQKFI